MEPEVTENAEASGSHDNDCWYCKTCGLECERTG